MKFAKRKMHLKVQFLISSNCRPPPHLYRCSTSRLAACVAISKTRFCSRATGQWHLRAELPARTKPRVRRYAGGRPTAPSVEQRGRWLLDFNSYFFAGKDEDLHLSTAVWKSEFLYSSSFHLVRNDDATNYLEFINSECSIEYFIRPLFFLEIGTSPRRTDRPLYSKRITTLFGAKRPSVLWGQMETDGGSRMPESGLTRLALAEVLGTMRKNTRNTAWR